MEVIVQRDAECLSEFRPTRSIPLGSSPRSIGDSGVRWVDAQRCCEGDEVILFLHKDPA
jgi:hypothetical protein